jgi:hypothetical protein
MLLIRVRLYGLLLGDNVTVTEYFQQGNQFVCENVLSECKTQKLRFSDIWSDEKRSQEGEWLILVA